MRLLSTVLLLIFFVNASRSQSQELLVQGQTGKLYLEHTVVAKENWYSVGRLYNITPKELTAFNQLALTQPLTIGQHLQIPLTAGNFSQNGQKLAAETLVPLYYIVQEKEWMYRVSVNHNKVPIPSLEKWNGINKDQVKAGMHMIVGYLKVKTALSALATGGGAPVVAAAKTPVEEKPAAGKTEEVKQVEEKPAVVKTSTEEKPAVTPVKQVAAPATSGEGEKTAIVKPAVEKPVEKPVEEKPAPVVEKSAATSTPATAGRFNGGTFKSDYSESGKSASGAAGTFKSTSGWSDGKYYALMNNIAVGTIVRVNDAATGKSVYAKVLGQLPDMKESAGLAIRISNAAAAELGQGEGRFNVEIKY
ncbi:MAG: LysM peptidoglycan-binding domain-containing protein [Bacteroidetes bacterium]|nr:LysM peptidoglycan-binding domain-containing protein [Bacteroidota bacterium]